MRKYLILIERSLGLDRLPKIPLVYFIKFDVDYIPKKD